MAVASNNKAAVAGSKCWCRCDSSLSDLAHSYRMIMTRKVSHGLAAKVNWVLDLQYHLLDD